jgi:hypothetical protein
MLIDESITHRRLSSGAELLWLPAEGPITAGMLFRTGRVDERLPTSGVNHLIEHLVLEALPRDLQVNGYVSFVETAFYIRGDAGEVASFFELVCAHLRDLPLDRLDAERRVLTAEHFARGPVGAGGVFPLRYGSVGPGLVGYEEYGLRTLEADDLRRWAAERFTARNAVIWVSGGDAPPDLDVDLTPGRRQAIPEPCPTAHRAYPSWVGWGSGGVALSMVMPPCAGVRTALLAARRRGHDRLRRDDGLIYDLGLDMSVLGPEVDHVMFAASAPADRSAAVASDMLEVLREIAADGPTDRELELEVDAWQKWQEDPTAGSGKLDRRALGRLVGRPITAGPAGVGREEAAQALAEAMESLLVVVPQGVRPSLNLPGESPAPEFRPAGGEVVRERGKRRKKTRFVIGDDGIAVAGPDPASRYGLPFAGCEAVIKGPAGSLTLIDDSGAWLALEPAILANGDTLGKRILAGVPQDRHVPMSAEEREVFLQLTERNAARCTGEMIEIIAHALEPGENVRMATLQAPYGSRVRLLVLSDRRMFLVDRLGGRITRTVALAYVDLDEVRRRTPLGDGVRFRVGGKSCCLTLRDEVEGARVQELLRDGMRDLESSGVPRSEDADRRAIARRIGGYRRDLDYTRFPIHMLIVLFSMIAAANLGAVPGTGIGVAFVLVVGATVLNRRFGAASLWASAQSMRTLLPVLAVCAAAAAVASSI